MWRKVRSRETGQCVQIRERGLIVEREAEIRETGLSVERSCEEGEWAE